jgi:hypothetical protein
MKNKKKKSGLASSNFYFSFCLKNIKDYHELKLTNDQFNHNILLVFLNNRFYKDNIIDNGKKLIFKLRI